jgi:hypothetical protein
LTHRYFNENKDYSADSRSRHREDKPYHNYRLIRTKIKYQNKSLKPLTYDEAKELLARLDDNIRVQSEYTDIRLQEEIVLAEEDNILLSHHILHQKKRIR